MYVMLSFCGISTFVGYLMPNSVFIYIYIYIYIYVIHWKAVSLYCGTIMSIHVSEYIYIYNVCVRGWLTKEIFYAEKKNTLIVIIYIFCTIILIRSLQRLKHCDKHDNKDEDNSPKNVNNVHNTSSKKYRQIH